MEVGGASDRMADPDRRHRRPDRLVTAGTGQVVDAGRRVRPTDDGVGAG